MIPSTTRRRLLMSGAAGLVLAPASRAGAANPPVTLTAGRRTLDVDGKAASVFGITQNDDTAGLVISVRERFRVHLVNDIGIDTLIHWHGLTPPYQQDGVPGVSGPPIAAAGSADYDFPLPMSGTYWMHSHVGFQEQLLMTAPLIIHGATPSSEREIVVMLHDFSFTDPTTIFARLRSRSTDAKPANAMAGMSEMAAPPDLNDVSYDAFLANDRTLAWFVTALHKVVEINSRRFPEAMRDTVLVPPKTNPGKWAFHGHNLYPLEAGMMTTLVYDGI